MSLEQPIPLIPINASDIPQNTQILFGFPHLPKGTYQLQSTPLYFSNKLPDHFSEPWLHEYQMYLQNSPNTQIFNDMGEKIKEVFQLFPQKDKFFFTMLQETSQALQSAFLDIFPYHENSLNLYLKSQIIEELQKNVISLQQTVIESEAQVQKEQQKKGYLESEISALLHEKQKWQNQLRTQKNELSSIKDLYTSDKTEFQSIIASIQSYKTQLEDQFMQKKEKIKRKSKSLKTVEFQGCTDVSALSLLPPIPVKLQQTIDNLQKELNRILKEQMSVQDKGYKEIIDTLQKELDKQKQQLLQQNQDLPQTNIQQLDVNNFELKTLQAELIESEKVKDLYQLEMYKYSSENNQLQAFLEDTLPFILKEGIKMLLRKPHKFSYALTLVQDTDLQKKIESVFQENAK